MATFILKHERDRSKFVAFCNHLVHIKSDVKIIVLKPPRSLSQNKYLHVCIKIFAGETGYTEAEMKEVLKEGYGLHYVKNGRQFLRSTTDLDTREMTNFIEWIRMQAAKQGIDIPSPDEATGNWASLQKTLETYDV